MILPKSPGAMCCGKPGDFFLSPHSPKGMDNYFVLYGNIALLWSAWCLTNYRHGRHWLDAVLCGVCLTLSALCFAAGVFLFLAS